MTSIEEFLKQRNIDEVEISEWLASLDYVLENGSEEQVKTILQQLQMTLSTELICQ